MMLPVPFAAKTSGTAAQVRLTDIQRGGDQSADVVRQANIAHGPQQINNAPLPVADPSRARENDIGQSKQSGGNHELLQDTRASTLAGGIGPQMETMGEIVTQDVMNDFEASIHCIHDEVILACRLLSLHIPYARAR